MENYVTVRRIKDAFAKAKLRPTVWRPNGAICRVYVLCRGKTGYVDVSPDGDEIFYSENLRAWMANNLILAGVVAKGHCERIIGRQHGER